MKGVTDFEALNATLLLADAMFAIATASLLTLVNSLSGTPYVTGGDSPEGTDCSGLVSFVTNAATGRPIYGDRFNTGNIESALKARGFEYGTKPGTLNVGWNRGHTAATLPDGTPTSSGEGGGVKVGGGGAYQGQFSKHMYIELPQCCTRTGGGAASGCRAATASGRRAATASGSRAAGASTRDGLGTSAASAAQRDRSS